MTPGDCLISSCDKNLVTAALFSGRAVKFFHFPGSGTTSVIICGAIQCVELFSVWGSACPAWSRITLCA